MDIDEAEEEPKKKRGVEAQAKFPAGKIPTKMHADAYLLRFPTQHSEYEACMKAKYVLPDIQYCPRFYLRNIICKMQPAPKQEDLPNMVTIRRYKKITVRACCDIMQYDKSEGARQVLEWLPLVPVDNAAPRLQRDWLLRLMGNKC
jgi:hypothetical protein